MSKQSVGGYTFNQEVARIRNSLNTIKSLLTTILEPNTGSQTIAILVAKSAIEISTIFEALSHLEKIGKETRKGRTQTEGQDRDPLGPAARE
jgi:hypothetical protein